MKRTYNCRKTSEMKSDREKSVVKKATAKRVSDFYRMLGVTAFHSIPVGEFKMYDHVNITQSAGSGV